jgi:hypothetical protein
MAKKAGRPLLYEFEDNPMKVFSVRLNVVQERDALKLGGGSLSDGIRKALEFAIQNKGKIA